MKQKKALIIAALALGLLLSSCSLNSTGKKIRDGFLWLPREVAEDVRRAAQHPSRAAKELLIRIVGACRGSAGLFICPVAAKGSGETFALQMAAAGESFEALEKQDRKAAKRRGQGKRPKDFKASWSVSDAETLAGGILCYKVKSVKQWRVSREKPPDPGVSLDDLGVEAEDLMQTGLDGGLPQSGDIA